MPYLASAWLTSVAVLRADGTRPEDSIDTAVGIALDDVILPRLQLQVQQEDSRDRLKAIQLLGWIAKALAMRQHPRLAKPLETVLAYLEAASLDLATAEEESATAEGLTGDCYPAFRPHTSL